jgi:hypothetical protein
VLVEAPGSYRIVPTEPAEPGPGEAVVRVTAAGMCGSDREIFAGTRPAPFVRYPVVPGHEWSGVVDAVGPGVAADLVGAAVVGEGFRACFVCARCRTGATNLCEAGYDETGFTQPGAFADQLDELDLRRTRPEFQGNAMRRNLVLADALRPVADRHGVSVAAIAVAWTLAFPGVTGAIVGARDPDHVDGWLPAASHELDDGDLAEIAASITATGAGWGPSRP